MEVVILWSIPVVFIYNRQSVIPESGMDSMSVMHSKLPSDPELDMSFNISNSEQYPPVSIIPMSTSVTPPFASTSHSVTSYDTSCPNMSLNVSNFEQYPPVSIIPMSTSVTPPCASTLHSVTTYDTSCPNTSLNVFNFEQYPPVSIIPMSTSVTPPCVSTSHSLTTYDVGHIVLGKVKLQNLSNSELYSYLKFHFTPKQDDVIKQVVVKGQEKKKKTLTFQLSWLDTFKWLAYSCSAGGSFCKFCVLFPPPGLVNTGVLVSTPFCDLKKACGVNGKLQAHGRLKCHRASAARVQAFMATTQHPERSIQHHLSEQARENYESNLHILSSITKAILYCSKQNIALRGHCDDQTSHDCNKGNFIALFQLLSEFDDELCRHLQFGKKNALYTSKTCQN